jgi:hypothetical protein
MASRVGGCEEEEQCKNGPRIESKGPGKRKWQRLGQPSIAQRRRNPTTKKKKETPGIRTGKTRWREEIS